MKTWKNRPARTRNRPSFFVDECIFRSWWVVVFFLLCHASYFQALQHRNDEYQLLSEHLQSLEGEKVLALEVQEDLNRQIHSQSDHAWLEMTLMKSLGVVPEGQVKVFFKN